MMSITALFVFRRNIKNTADETFLKTCRFNSSDADGLYCPIFSLGQIVDMIEKTKEVPHKQDFQELSTLVRPSPVAVWGVMFGGVSL